jgi:hypothetical protein
VQISHEFNRLLGGASGEMMSHQLESARLSFVPCSETDLDLLRIHWTQAEVRRFLFDDQIVEPEAVSGLIANSQSSFSRQG